MVESITVEVGRSPNFALGLRRERECGLIV